MKTLYLILSCLFFTLNGMAQADTLVGILRDKQHKPLKKYLVTLGNAPARQVKTNKDGIFSFPDANLRDTLYVQMKKAGKELRIPVGEFPFLEITLLGDCYEADYKKQPEPYILEKLARERNKVVSSHTITREEITQIRCQDIYCVLRRMSGVMIQNGNVKIRGSVSFNSSTNALIVVNGIPMNDGGVLSSIPIHDIEEITVLKEATQYGAQGANGALLIKTSK